MNELEHNEECGPPLFQVSKQRQHQYLDLIDLIAGIITLKGYLGYNALLD